MPGISRLKSPWHEAAGLNEWGERVLIPGNMDEEIIETDQFFRQGSIDISKIKNLVVDSIVATTGTIGAFDIGPDYIRDAANSFGLASTVTGGDDVRFWAGATYANRATAPARITEAGAATFTSISITSGDLTGTFLNADSVDTAELVDLAVETAKLNDLAVTTGKIALLAVQTAQIDALAVTTAKIDALAVTAAKIDALAVTTAKIDNLAVTTGKIALLAVQTAQIDSLAVTDAKISDLAVSKLTAGTISSKSILLAVAAGTGDVEIRAGIAAGDFSNAGAASGFIWGIDDSDSDLAKFYVGNASNYIEWTGSALNIAGSLAVGSIPNLPTDDLLFGHWGMDEGSGLTIIDLSGNARTGTGVGTTYAQGVVNQGLSFNGTDYVSISGAASLPTAAISVSIWVKATAPGDSYRIIWHDWAAAGDWIMYSDATNWVWGVRDGTNTQQLVASAHGGSTTWHHLVGTYDGATSRFYVDGVEVGTALAFAVALNTGGTFRLSHDAFNTFQGTMDECAIYTSALSANQVKALYTNPSGNANSGLITARAGLIGGFDIGADYIRDVANSFGLASTVTAGDDVRFWAGDTYANRATADFRVTESGVVHASAIVITSDNSTINGTSAVQVEDEATSDLNYGMFRGHWKDTLTESVSSATITRSLLTTKFDPSAIAGASWSLASGTLGIFNITGSGSTFDWTKSYSYFIRHASSASAQDSGSTKGNSFFWGLTDSTTTYNSFIDTSTCINQQGRILQKSHAGFIVGWDNKVYASSSSGLDTSTSSQDITDLSGSVTHTDFNNYRVETSYAAFPAISDTGFTRATATADPDAGWTNEANAIDADTNTFAECTAGQHYAHQIALSWDGGTNYTIGVLTGINGTAAKTVFTLGGQYSTWGRTWSVSEFTNANFVVSLMPTVTDFGDTIANEFSFSSFGFDTSTWENITGIEVEITAEEEDPGGGNRDYIYDLRIKVYYTTTANTGYNKFYVNETLVATHTTSIARSTDTPILMNMGKDNRGLGTISSCYNNYRVKVTG